MVHVYHFYQFKKVSYHYFLTTKFWNKLIWNKENRPFFNYLKWSNSRSFGDVQKWEDVLVEGVSPPRFAGLPFVVLLGESAFVKKTQTPCYYKSFEVLNHCAMELGAVTSAPHLCICMYLWWLWLLPMLPMVHTNTGGWYRQSPTGLWLQVGLSIFQIRNRVLCVCVSQIFIENPLVALLLLLQLVLAPTLSEKHWHQAVLKKNSHLINLLMSDAIPITIRYLLDVP